MKFLITGGAGFIGSNLARHLLSKGHEVIIYDNLSRAGSELILKHLKSKFPKFDFVRKELDDIPEFLRSAKDLDAIFHFAAQVAVTKSYESPKSDFRINALGTFTLVTSADVPVIYASTNKVYGDNVNKIPVEELETRYDFADNFKGKGIPETFSVNAKKHTPYGCSKLTGELYVKEYGGVANRFSCIFGEFQNGTADQGWLAHFVYTKMRNEPIDIFGDGKQVRDILHVNDVVNLLELEALNIDKIKGEVFNVGGGFKSTISLQELISILGLTPKFHDWRTADQKVYYSDISKAQKLLGWEPKISKAEGLSRLIDWARENPDFWKKES